MRGRDWVPFGGEGGGGPLFFFGEEGERGLPWRRGGGSNLGEERECPLGVGGPLGEGEEGGVSPGRGGGSPWGGREGGPFWGGGGVLFLGEREGPFWVRGSVPLGGLGPFGGGGGPFGRVGSLWEGGVPVFFWEVSPLFLGGEEERGEVSPFFGERRRSPFGVRGVPLGGRGEGLSPFGREGRGVTLWEEGRRGFSNFPIPCPQLEAVGINL